jgi:orotidine-5'-phosphate decarboxylase
MANLTVTPIVALDVGSSTEALALVERLGGACRYYKVGSELFTAAGPEFVGVLRGRGCEVFLDLKFHDIPNTVAGAVRSAAAAGASLVTVHASGGPAMLRAAAVAAESTPSCRVLGVTVLTSLDVAALGEAWGRESAVSVEAEVLRLAGFCADAGLHGIVCSGQEARPVRERFDDRLALLVPGIRFADGATHDQSRVVTPVAAAAAGARYLVLGRAVTGAADPAAAMARVHTELGGAVETLG